MGMTDAKLGFTKIGFLFFLLLSPLLGKNYFGLMQKFQPTTVFGKF